ncbi:MAG: DUF2630 family protein [Verrucomicrobia bacterium]|nr:DUF2630 family protein [Verrucomicrobiota bacterium]
MGKRILVSLELGEKFNPPKDTLGNVVGQHRSRSHHAVEPEHNLRQWSSQLQMNIARSGLLRLLDKGLDQCWCGLLRIRHIDRERQFHSTPATYSVGPGIQLFVTAARSALAENGHALAAIKTSTLTEGAMIFRWLLRIR